MKITSTNIPTNIDKLKTAASWQDLSVAYRYTKGKVMSDDDLRVLSYFDVKEVDLMAKIYEEEIPNFLTIKYDR